MLSASRYGPVNSKAEKPRKRFEDITTNSPERRNVVLSGKYLRLPGRRAAGSHFLSAGGWSVTPQASASQGTLTLASAGDTQAQRQWWMIKKRRLSFKLLQNRTCVLCGYNSEAHNYKTLPVRCPEPWEMIIDRPPLPPPAANACKICILSKQINPLILDNDFESMATGSPFLCEIQ